MSEIKIGEYVRTKKGKIGKVIDIDIRNSACYLDCNSCVSLENIKNHKEKILDLIEVGDFINSEVVWSTNNKKGIETVSGYYMIQDIKSIVTKEQFEKEAYKVGD